MSSLQQSMFDFHNNDEHEHSDIELSGTNHYPMQQRISVEEIIEMGKKEPNLYDDKTDIAETEVTEMNHLNAMHVQQSYSTSSRDTDLRIDDPKEPRFKSLKSKLLTPKDIIIHNNNTPKYMYNPVANGAEAADRTETGVMTPHSIKNTIYDKLENTQSAVDEILYDPTPPAPCSTNDLDTLTVPKLNNVHIGNQSWNSSYDLDEDEVEEYDRVNRTQSMMDEDEQSNNSLCSNYCIWLKKYAASLLFTILCWLIYIFLQYYWYPQHRDHDLTLPLLYVQQIVFILSVVMSFLMLWKFISYSLFLCTANHCCHGNKCERFIFYVHHSSEYISYSCISTVAFIQWRYLLNNPDERVTEILDNTDPEHIDAINRILLCFMILCLGLFVKTIFIRWVVLKFYLSNLVLKFKQFRKYESWLKMITGKQIFSQRVKHFLDINSLHQQNHADYGLINLNRTVAFRLDVLRDFNLMGVYSSGHINRETFKKNMDTISEVEDNASSSSENESDILHESVNSKLVNTLTSGRMFGNLACASKSNPNSQTCLLWLYNSKTDETVLIDDNELNKICKEFSKCIVAIVTKHRFSSAHSTRRKNKRTSTKPTVTELKTWFKQFSDVKDGDSSGGERENKPKVPHKLKRQSITLQAEFISQKEFIECFAKYNQTKQGYEAWKEINKSDAQLTKKELQRWLYQYLHDLIYLKQKLNSYHDILLNLDASTHSIAIFVLVFVCLLIGGYDLIDAVTIYFTFCALLAVFGKNIFVQFFDALYFVFVLQPFSIGDVVLIDDKRYTITKIHVMNTEMRTAVADGNTVIIKNNAKLLGKDIKNVSKTKSPYHNISFYVSQNTTIDQLEKLKAKLNDYVKLKMKNDVFDMWFVLDGIDKECRMKISLFVGSLYSFSDTALMWRQYHMINVEIVRLVKQMNIQYKRFSNQDIQLSALIDEKEQEQLI